MARILVVQSSARGADSCSRKIVGELVALLQRQSGPHEILLRDLASDPVPIMNDGIVREIRTRIEELSAEQRAPTALSEWLIGELKAADLIVIGSPMYNWSIPAALKAWIDQVVRLGQTFDYGSTGPRGLLGGKPAVVVLSRGGQYSAPERAHLDFQKPYLTQILNVIGLEPSFVLVENTLRGAEALDASLAAAREEIRGIAASLAL